MCAAICGVLSCSQRLGRHKQTNSVEFQQMQQQVVSGIEAGNKALSELQEQLSVDDVERIMDEAADGIAYAEEINSILAGKLNSEDDSAVELEFEKMFMDELPELPADLPVPEGAAAAEELPVPKTKTSQPQLVPA
eukprot:m.26638 g.26638  ORF g.26638 m.26638 type:complete len:136 (+) comp4627_c0_seq1:323-730(+)